MSLDPQHSMPGPTSVAVSKTLQRFRRVLARRSRGFKSYARMMRRRDPNWRTAFHEKPYVPRWNKPDYSPRQSI